MKALIPGVLIMMLLTGRPAAGGLVAADYQTPGDALLTLDPDTGLEWLDLTLTAGWSYNEIVAGALGLLTTEGFRYATTAEVGAFFEHAGLLINQLEWLEPVDAAEALLQLIGTTYQDDYDQVTFGYTADPSPFVAANQTISSVGIHDFDGIRSYAAVATLNDSYGADSSHISVGSWLVRPALIPEPGSGLLLIAGSAALLGLKRKRTRPTCGRRSGIAETAE